MTTDSHQPVELAEVGRRYRFRSFEGITEGVLVEIRQTPTDRTKLWCMFRIDDRSGLHGCAMRNVIEALPPIGGYPPTDRTG